MKKYISLNNKPEIHETITLNSGLVANKNKKYY